MRATDLPRDDRPGSPDDTDICSTAIAATVGRGVTPGKSHAVPHRLFTAIGVDPARSAADRIIPDPQVWQAATRPEQVSGIVEINPFTRKVQYSLGGLLRIRRYRRCSSC